MSCGGWEGGREEREGGMGWSERGREEEREGGMGGREEERRRGREGGREEREGGMKRGADGGWRRSTRQARRTRERMLPSSTSPAGAVITRPASSITKMFVTRPYLGFRD